MRTLGALLLVFSAGCASLPGAGGTLSEVRGVAALLPGGGATYPLVCGHRGDFYGSLHNTLASIKRARELGADLAEVDVRLTADRVPVLEHGSWPHRKTLEEARTGRPELATLADALEFARDRIVLVLDVKDPDVAPVFEVVRRAAAQERVLLLAGSEEEYARFKQAGDDLFLMVRARNATQVRSWLDRDDPHVVWIHVDHEWVTPAVVEAVHAGNRRLFANSYKATWHAEYFGARSSVHALLERGIDVVQTNHVAAAARERDAWRRGER